MRPWASERRTSKGSQPAGRARAVGSSPDAAVSSLTGEWAWGKEAAVYCRQSEKINRYCMSGVFAPYSVSPGLRFSEDTARPQATPANTD